MRLDEAQFTHLVIEGIGAKGCEHGYTVRSFLLACVREMGMTPVGEPVILKFPPCEGHDDSGVTGFQVIVESHLAVHTWPEWENLVAIDLFSCKAFDVSRLRRVCNSFWQFSYMSSRTVERNRVLEMISKVSHA